MCAYLVCLSPAPLTSKLANDYNTGGHKNEGLFHRVVALNLDVFMNIDIEWDGGNLRRL